MFPFNKINSKSENQKRLGKISLLSLAVIAMNSSYAQTDSDIELEEVTVTGFRSSLNLAREIKRENVASVDVVMAEDIAKMPDQNLAESLQRIPGIAITRDSGEGREVSVRGLNGSFTRIRINGMEAVAGTGGEGGPNRGRQFDFNVFASELFNKIVVRKTAEAKIDEGSLGAVIDLYTGRPFDFSDGMTFVTSLEGQYNDLSEDLGPRIAALYAYNDPNGLWGASASLAYSDNTTKELGQNTVRWQQADFASVGGVACDPETLTGDCLEVANGFHARIPRYGEIEYARKRLGFTGSLQFKPTEKTTISLDVLYSEYDASRGERWLEVLFRGNEDGMDVIDYTLDPATNNLTSMTVNNAWVRNENFEKAWTTTFNQISLDVLHEFNDTFTGHFLLGQSESELDFPYEITFMYDDRDYNGFHYDYRDDKYPVLAYNGPDVSDASNFQLSELRDRPTNTVHGFDNISADFTWQINDALSLDFGLSYKTFSFDTEGYRRDTGICAAELYDCDPDGDGVDELYGVPATAELSDLYVFDDKVGTGSTRAWVVPSLSAWSRYFGLSDLELREDQGNIRTVDEKDSGLFVQLNGVSDVGNMALRYNVGVRYVETDQSSSGYNSGQYVTVDRDTYDDVLPSINFALDITPELLWRAGWSRVMTRPSLGNLTPGGSVDSFNYRVSYQNPYLDPTRADAFDTSIEWYFAEEALLSFAFFTKDIESRPLREETEGTYASTGLPLSLLAPTSPAERNPEGQPWAISSIENGPGGELQGFEISLQAPFAVFGGEGTLLENFGFIANYTIVDSDVQYPFGEETVTERLLGLSNNSYNATLYYEDDKFNARISVAYRDEYLSGTSGTGNRFEGYGATTYVDFTAGYAISDNLEVSFDALNLTDNYQDRWTDIASKRRYEWDHTGPIYKVGIKYQY